MIAQKFNIEVDEESDFTNRFYYIDNSTGLPIDLTGYRADMQVRINYEGAENSAVALTYSSDSGKGIILGGSAGTVDLTIGYNDTLGKTWNRATYDLFLYLPNGTRSKFYKGLFTILPSTVKIADNILTDISSNHTPPYTQPNNFDVKAKDKPNP